MKQLLFVAALAAGVVVVSCGARGALAAESILERGDAMVVSNATDMTEANVLRVMYGTRGIDKFGAGGYTLPRGLVDAHEPLALNAREGSVSVTDGGTLPAETKPTDVLNLADFWLDAAVNQETNENGEITFWYDCREQKEGEVWGEAYARAKTLLTPKGSNSAVYTPVMPTATTPEGMSLPMIHFGGYQTGTGMDFYKTNSVALQDYDAIRHVYAVLNFQKAYGFPFGGNSGLMLHPTGYASPTLVSRYCSGDARGFAAAGEFLVNGVRCNPMDTDVKKGLQLVEIHAASDAPLGSFGRLFNDRNIAGRYGGDYVGEVLVFNSKSLTPDERLRVSRYLMDKWGIVPVQAPLTVRVGASAAVREVMPGTTVEGYGTVERIGTESAHYRPTAASPASGLRVHLGSGTMKADARELPLAVKPGEALSLATDNWGVHTVTAGAAATGEASVSGASEAVRFGRVDDGVDRLTVGAKSVILGDAGVGGARLSADIGSATIANASFENAFSAADWVWVTQNGSSGRKTFSRETDVLDWRISGAGTDMTAFQSKYRLSRFMPTDGKVALILKQANCLYGHVDVSKDGDYELVFDATGRYLYDNMQLVLSLVDSTEKTNTFACCVVAIGSGFRPFRFPMSGIKAGAYKLVIESQNCQATNSSDSHAMLDNFRMAFVTDGPSSVGAVPVPNGSFENTRITKSSRVVTTFSTNDVASAGWTLTDVDAPAAGTVGFAAQVMKSYYLPTKHNQGTWQLRFNSTFGRATSAAFTLPAGRWNLRCKAAKWAFDNIKWNDVYERNFTPKLAVRVLKNGTEAFDETSAGLSAYEWQNVVFKNVLEVDADDQVVLEIRQAVTNAALNVDDLEFVPVGTWGSSTELVKYRSFVDGTTGWTALGTVYPKSLNGGYEQHYGGQQCDDDKAVCFVNAGSISQDLDFPAAGLYRLSFWARSRVSYYGGVNVPNSREYGGNVLRASLIVGSETNAIVETPPVFSTNFNQTVALFRVPTNGTHRLRIEGLNNPNAGVWTGGSKNDANVFLDCVSVMAAPADGAMPELPANLELKLTGDSKLRLDYDGEATVYKLKIGAKHFHGRVDATVAPDLVTGPGVLNVTSPTPGALLLVR